MFRSADHRMMFSSSWAETDTAEEIADGIYMSHGNANSYLVVGEAGDVMIQNAPEPAPLTRASLIEAEAAPA
jgi:hypothetical protein